MRTTEELKVWNHSSHRKVRETFHWDPIVFQRHWLREGTSIDNGCQLSGTGRLFRKSKSNAGQVRQSPQSLLALLTIGPAGSALSSDLPIIVIRMDSCFNQKCASSRVKLSSASLNLARIIVTLAHISYCTISFNSAVTRHGTLQNAEMSRLSQQFLWCAEFIW